MAPDDLQPLERSLRPLKRGSAALVDPLFLLALAAGFLAWLLPEPARRIPWTGLFILAAAEEIVFRGVLQGMLSRRLPQKVYPAGLSRANLITSGIFSLAHVFSHPPAWAGAVFFPSLLFGWSKDRFHSLLPCCLLHFFYNLLFFYRP
jgi:hypothetical protein